MDGAVPGESLSEDLLRVVLAEAQRRQKTQRRSLKRRRRDKSGLDFESFRQRMFIEPSVASFVGPSAVAQVVALHNYTVVERGEALCFVMKDPTAVKNHQRTAWACGLSGGIACDVAYFFSAGKEGVAIKHTSRILSKKKSFLGQTCFNRNVTFKARVVVCFLNNEMLPTFDNTAR